KAVLAGERRAHQLAGLSSKAGIADRAEAAPGPAPGSHGRGEADLPCAPAIPEGRAAQRCAAIVIELGPYLHVGVWARVVMLRRQRHLALAPGVKHMRS